MITKMRLRYLPRPRLEIEVNEGDIVFFIIPEGFDELSPKQRRKLVKYQFIYQLMDWGYKGEEAHTIALNLPLWRLYAEL